MGKKRAEIILFQCSWKHEIMRLFWDRLGLLPKSPTRNMGSWVGLITMLQSDFNSKRVHPTFCCKVRGCLSRLDHISKSYLLGPTVQEMVMEFLYRRDGVYRLRFEREGEPFINTFWTCSPLFLPVTDALFDLVRTSIMVQ
jgi:hypothetical protein